MLSAGSRTWKRYIRYNTYMHGLSHLVITKNSGSLLARSLESSRGLVDEIVVVDASSSDNTREIAKAYGARIYESGGNDLGRQRSLGLSQCRGKWVLMLDADEEVGQALKDEIRGLHADSVPEDGFFIPYQNHFLGRPVYHGGEDYRVLRLFRRDKASISENPIHEHAVVAGRTGVLKNHILHYSYRTLPQTFAKFTDYAKREAGRKTARGERSGIRKLLAYPAHMFWARYIKDKGYRDFPLRILLDFGFAYMEFLTYFLMLLHPQVDKEA